jgi:hypothetical protein
MQLDPAEIGRRIIDFDPARPRPEFFSTATQMAAALADGLVADAVLFPAALAPTLDTPAKAPAPADPLPKADVVIVTWTGPEADTLARLLTPGVDLIDWYEYKHNLGHYTPLINGPKAPFNSKNSSRYYRSLGIYYPIKLVGKKVLCLKSGLHLDHDTKPPPPADLPMLDWWKQVLAETGAEFIITTGTGGAIGTQVLLGDVVIAADTVFDCTTQFAQETFHNASYATTPLPAGWTTPPAAMLRANAQRVAQSDQPSHPGDLPAFFYPGSVIPQPKIVTTDQFAFDDTTNSYHLQGLGDVCDMGDAALGLVISGMAAADRPSWAAIRNASDPQVNAAQGNSAYDIYNTYGALTSVGSVLATWSLICARYAPNTPLAAAAGAAAPATLTAANLREARQSDPTHLLMQIAAAQGFSAQPLPGTRAPPDAAAALATRLRQIKVDPSACQIDWNVIRYVDETRRRQQLTLAHVSNDGSPGFRGSYLQRGATIVAQEEFAAETTNPAASAAKQARPRR